MITTATFAIARYVPDLVRGDGYNVGVILRSQNGSWIDSKFVPDVKKISDLWPDAQPQVVQLYIDGIKRLLMVRPKQPQLRTHLPTIPPSVRDDGFFAYLKQASGNTVQITDLREMRVTQPLHLELERLYRRYVWNQEKPKEPPLTPIARQVRDHLRTAKLIGPQALREQEEPVTGKYDIHRIEYLGQNGILHAVHPQDLKGARASDTASKWRGKYLDLAAQKGDPNAFLLHMFVSVPAGIEPRVYAPTAMLIAERGIRVYASIHEGVNALARVFDDH